MPQDAQDGGGRLELFTPSQLTDSQKTLYDFINRKMVPWAESSGFRAKLSDGRFIGPFNPILASPEVGRAFLDLQEAEQAKTSLGVRVRQVIILSVGAVWKSDYEQYAHSAVARKVGLSDEAIRSLTLGEPSHELNNQEDIAQRLTLQLTREHQVGDQLYREALATFGVQGIVDLVVLAGCYDTVSSLLNMFRVPVPE